MIVILDVVYLKIMSECIMEANYNVMLLCFKPFKRSKEEVKCMYCTVMLYCYAQTHILLHQEEIPFIFILYKQGLPQARALNS